MTNVRPNARKRVPEQIVAALPEIVARAQAVYDDWAQDDEGFDEELGEGGICHLIADEVVDVLTNAGVEAKPVWSEGVGENHVWALVKIPDGPHQGVWMVDIPPEVYESGSGYSWRKKPDVAIHRDHVVLYRESANPDDFDDEE
jgi:hypothetical protein